MSAVAFIAGVALAWPGFIMLAGHMNGDIRSRSLPLAIALSAAAVALILIGATGLGGSGMDADLCGSGPTAFDC